jgi:hypothetical protein
VSEPWVNSGAAMFDFAIDGVPFYSAASSENPYVRETAETRRPQIDTSAEPGEQSFGPWWLRSQSSFDKGAGVRFFDTARDDTGVITRRFANSAGVDVWTPGEVSLLNRVEEVTNPDNSNPLITQGGRAETFFTGIGSGTQGKKGVLVSNRQASKLRFVDAATGEVHLVDPSVGSGDIVDITVDGQNYYCLTTGGVFKGTIPDNIGEPGVTVTPATRIYKWDESITGQPGAFRGFIVFAKERLFFGINRYLYNLTPTPKRTGSNARTLGKPEGTYSSTEDNNYAVTNKFIVPHHLLPEGFDWVDAVDGPSGVYLIANSEETSYIYSITLQTGTIKFDAPTIVAEAPGGERFTVLLSYLGTYLIVGSNRGVRVGVFGGDNTVLLGPLSIRSDKRVLALHASGDYVWAGGANVGGKFGLYRLNLAEPIGNTGTFPYAKDIACDRDFVPAGDVRAIVQYGGRDRLAFVLRADAGSIGADLRPIAGFFVEQPERVQSGWLRTGRIRFDTTLGKYFHKLRVSSLRGDGVISAKVRFNDKPGFTELGDWTVSSDPETSRVVEFNGSRGNYQWAQFDFTLTRDSGEPTQSPIMSSYQVAAMPVGVRGGVVQVPLLVMDRERGAGGTMVSRPVQSRLERIEAADKAGRPVLFQDLVTGESRMCLIERVQFVATVSPETHAQSRGGVLTVTLRTIDEDGSAVILPGEESEGDDSDSVTIVYGPTGPQGPAGPQGPEGDPGFTVDHLVASQMTDGVETYPRIQLLSGNGSLLNGEVRLSYFTPVKTTDVTGITMITGATAQAGATLVRFGLYSVDTSTGALTLVARTANDTTALALANTSFRRLFNSSGGYPETVTLEQGQRYAVGAIVVGATTTPTMHTTGTGAAVLSQAPRLSGNITSQTDLPASTAGNPGNSGQMHWARLS